MFFLGREMLAAVTGPWTPAPLFTSGELGFVHDYTDFSKQWKHGAAGFKGIDNVSATGDLIAIILDSKGVDLTPGAIENINPNFDTDTVWNKGPGWTISGGIGHHTGGGGYLKQAGIALGRTYLATMEVTTASASNMAAIYFGESAYISGFAQTPMTLVSRGLAFATALGYAAYGVGTCDISTLSFQPIAGTSAAQDNATKAPVMAQHANGVYYANFDGVDDAMQAYFTSAPGSNCTVAYAIPGVGASITTGVTIGAGIYSYNTDCSALVVVNRALSGSETASLTAWLNERAGV